MVLHRPVELAPLPDISNNVGSVKSFLNAPLHSLCVVVFLVIFDLCIDDHARRIFRSASVRPKHLFDPYFDHDTNSNSFAGSGMPNQVDGVLLHTHVGTELSHVRTAL